MAAVKKAYFFAQVKRKIQGEKQIKSQKLEKHFSH
jgi:hypothetical protein